MAMDRKRKIYDTNTNADTAEWCLAPAAALAERAHHAPVARMRRRSLLRVDRGASAVEYALLIAGIAAVIIVAVAFVGRTVSGQFSKVGSSIATTN